MIIIIYNITHNNKLNQHVTNPQHDNQHYGVAPFGLFDEIVHMKFWATAQNYNVDPFCTNYIMS